MLDDHFTKTVKYIAIHPDGDVGYAHDGAQAFTDPRWSIRFNSKTIRILYRILKRIILFIRLLRGDPHCEKCGSFHLRQKRRIYICSKCDYRWNKKK